MATNVEQMRQALIANGLSPSEVDSMSEQALIVECKNRNIAIQEGLNNNANWGKVGDDVNFTTIKNDSKALDSDKPSKDEFVRNALLKSTGKGAAAGAVLGSFIAPGLGTIAGAVAGAVLTLAMSPFAIVPSAIMSYEEDFSQQIALDTNVKIDIDSTNNSDES